jgi:hypothetical protein
LQTASDAVYSGYNPREIYYRIEAVNARGQITSAKYGASVSNPGSGAPVINQTMTYNVRSGQL